ncbi:MAG: hypothetical protein WC750_04970 [Patescibacteria group bacterium]|jgi:hypothetical protein
MKTLLRTWWFGLFLGACLITFEILTLLVPIFSTPTGDGWLGAGIYNTRDMAVYLNYLAQAKQSFLITNLFNHLPQIPRFDLFWSTGGWLVRAGLSPLWAHEILRWVCTIFLGLAVYATAKAVTQTERHARLASFLIISGLSTGWLYDLWMGVTNKWTPRSPVTADLAGELAVAPTLLGGAHMILSFALLLLIVRWIWEAIFSTNKKSLLYACLAILVLSAFHPYFIPLLGLISLAAFFSSLKSRNLPALLSQGGSLKAPLINTLLINLSLLPSALYYFWILVNDQGFRIHQIQVNFLPLDAWYLWVILLLPFIPALVWNFVFRIWNLGPDPNTQIPNTKFQIQNSWAMVWIASAIVCMLLPFPWTRKYMQGLLPALIILTLPFWLMLADKINAKKIILPLKVCLIVLLAFPYIHLFQTQVFMVTDSYWSKSFYRSTEVFDAWKYIQQTSEREGLILATDLWSNCWTPAYTTQKVWIGHEHETPDFKSRITPYLAWTKTHDVTDFRDYLNNTPVTRVMAVDTDQVARLKNLMDQAVWEPVYGTAKATVWQRK